MNVEKLKFYIDYWYDYIEKKNMELLEKEIGMSFKEFVMQILINVYNDYKEEILCIPVSKDDCQQYIIAHQNGYYSLEDFLINRLLRNISMIEYKENFGISDYDETFGCITIDKERMEMQLKDIQQKRKLVAHELLHGLKTQFADNNIFRFDEYFELKEKLKMQKGNEIHDFDYIEGYGQNGICAHLGLDQKKRYWKLLNKGDPYYDAENLDEIFNELDAIRVSNDKYKETMQFVDSGLCIIIKNPESSNAYITNYAYIIERLLDKETLFSGMYINPHVMFEQINKLYTDIFQKQYNSDKTAIEIILEQLYFIKNNCSNTDMHVNLLNTLFVCMNRKYILSNYNEEMRKQNIICLGTNGLLEIFDGRLKIYNGLAYVDEYDSVKNNSK